MAARRGKTQAKRGGGLKTGLVLVVGLGLGLALAAGYLIFGDRDRLDALLPQPNPQAQAPTPARDREPVAQEPQALSDEPKPTFDFYTVLPGKEVELPGESSAAAETPATTSAPAAATPAVPATSAAPTAAAAAAPSAGQLQAGAFSNAADAEALRARLALLGQSARIESVQSNGRTLHRVRLGPYADADALARAQAALTEAGIAATPAR